MKINKHKTTAISIAMLLIISMATSMLLVSPTAAHVPPYQIKTYALVECMPSTTGVGQTIVVYAFLGNAPPPQSAETNNYRFHNYKVTFVSPSGKTDVKTYDTVRDTTGVQTITFTPDEVGTYNITFNYGGQTLHYPEDTASNNPTTGGDGDVYLPSSDTATLVVLEQPIFTYPDSYPLPTEYWTRPIYAENPYWWIISSNWLGTGSPANSKVSAGTITGIGMSSLVQRFPGDAVGSLTSHIMWTKPIQSGGVVGGSNFEIQGDTYFEGSAYSQRYINPIIVNGKLYYNPPLSFLGTVSGPTTCVDLRTGKVLWERRDMPPIDFAMIWDLQDGNQHGVWPALLCTNNFGRVFDADTGDQLFNVTGVPSFGSAIVQGPSGEQIRYVMTTDPFNPSNYVLGLWNSTLMWSGTFFRPGTSQSGNSPILANATGGVNIGTPPSATSASIVNASIFDSSDLQNRYSWNVSIPWRAQTGSSTTILNAIYGDYMICRNGSYPTLSGQTANASGTIYPVLANYTYFKVDINPKSSTFGQVLWYQNVQSLNDKTITYGGLDPTVGIFVEGIKETRNFNAYKVSDGSKAWGPSQSQTDLDYFGNPIYPYIASQLAFGKLYSYAFGGILYCYDLNTGNLEWSYGNGGIPGNNTDSGFQAPGYYPGFIQAVGGHNIDDGILYIAVTEHTIETPVFKGSFIRAINASNGAELWSINDYTGEFRSVSLAIADGYTNFFNGEDNQIYTLGRGPTTLTVSAPDLAAASGQPVVIKGTVYDVSAGAQQDMLASRFARGLPVAADSCMTDWMGYLYQQKPLPANFTGVDVVINVIDANGNYRTIGTVKTDATGQYNLVWQPDIDGKYSVIASFAGTKGYWPASANTAFTVMQPAATASPPPTLQTSMVEQYFVPAVVGIILAIIIVGIAIVLVLRKRP